MVSIVGGPVAWTGLACFFFCIFSLARFGFNLGFLDRPLVIGLFWSALTGQAEVALPVALFFELFYLDLFPIGTFVPPHGPFALLVALALMQIFNVTQPPLAALLILLSMPATMLGKKLEQQHRQRQNLGYTRMLQSTRPGQEGNVSSRRLVHAALLQTCLMQAAAFLLVMALLVPLVERLLIHVRIHVLVIPLSWPHLWMLGTLGALLSFRVRRVYAAFLGIVLAAGVFFGLGQGLL